jgi:phenylalanyl-tRNA synthetase beta chain
VQAAAGVAVEIAAGDICPFYSARVIRGLRVGPSPAWLVDRLRTVGVESVNNVVDVTNYVMLEAGQPLHAFDLAKLRGGRIVVRRARDGEPFEAINHKTYTLDERMCVIADAERPVALAGVMGGADSEIGAGTTDVLLESAQFAPLPVRAAARELVLASGSSYRFERGPDPAMVDWASRRAAALILEIAGGTLDRGTATAGRLASAPAVIPLRPERVREVLGVDVPATRQQEVLTARGFAREPATAAGPAWRAPTWRRDAWREIDLVEEVARIEGYDRVPENVPVAVRSVEWSARERTVRTAGDVLVAAGFCEALTRSVVAAELEAAPSPWGEAAALVISPPLVRGADRLRRTLLPSLLEARGTNVAAGAPHAELFEIARGYLARSGGPGPTPVEEPLLLAFAAAGDFFRGKGLVAAVLERLGVTHAAADAGIEYRPVTIAACGPGRAAEVILHRPGLAMERVAVVGEAAAAVLETFGLEPPVVVAEVRLDRLEFAADLERVPRRPSDYPAVQRDVNLVVDELVPWGDLEAAIRAAAGDLLEECRLVQVWQDEAKLGAGRKSVVVALRLRSDAGTIAGPEAARVIDAVVAECGRRTGATLRG